MVKQKRLLTGKPHSWLLGLDIATGKKTFEISTEAEDYKFYPMNISPIAGTSDVLLLGTYYEPDGKVMKDASLGLAAWTINSAGKIIFFRSYFSCAVDRPCSKAKAGVFHYFTIGLIISAQ